MTMESHIPVVSCRVKFEMRHWLRSTPHGPRFRGHIFSDIENYYVCKVRMSFWILGNKTIRVLERKMPLSQTMYSLNYELSPASLFWNSKHGAQHVTRYGLNRPCLLYISTCRTLSLALSLSLSSSSSSSSSNTFFPG